MASPWVYAEMPVFTAFILTCVGYWYRTERRESHERDKAIAEQSKALAVLVESIRPIREWQMNADRDNRDRDGRINHNTRRIDSLSENTAVLSAVLERHEDWHSRSEGGQTEPGRVRLQA